MDFWQLFHDGKGKPCLALVLGGLGFVYCLIAFIIFEWANNDFNEDTFKFIFITCSVMLTGKSITDTLVNKSKGEQ